MLLLVISDANVEMQTEGTALIACFNTAGDPHLHVLHVPRFRLYGLLCVECGVGWLYELSFLVHTATALIARCTTASFSVVLLLLCFLPALLFRSCTALPALVWLVNVRVLLCVIVASVEGMLRSIGWHSRAC